MIRFETMQTIMEEESHSEPESEPGTREESMNTPAASRPNMDYGTILDADKDSPHKDSPHKDTEKWTPWRIGFYNYHFGTDLLIASWLFVLSSALWGGMALDALFTEADSSADVPLQQWCQLISATLFTLGSFFMIGSAHPIYMAGLKSSAALRTIGKNASSLSFSQRYITGNDVLMAGWFFAVCTSPFFVLGAYLIEDEPRNAIGYLYVIGSCASSVALGVWIVGALPENIQLNEGMGSTHVYDYLCSLFGIEKKKFSDYYHADLIIGMWLFFLGALGAFPYGLYLVSTEPNETYAWLTFLMFSTFLGGASLMVHSSYPENMNSTVVADFFVFKKRKHQQKKEFYEAALTIFFGEDNKLREQEQEPLLDGDANGNNTSTEGIHEEKTTRGASMHADGAPDDDPENPGEE